MTRRSRKAVFLDRDGVLNRVVMRGSSPCSPRTLDEFDWEQGVADAVQVLKKAGFLTIVVTNQPDITRRKIDGFVLEAMTERLYRELVVDDVYICPHDEADLCHCRKPKPGMILDASQKWGIDRLSSFLIGDSWKDMGAAAAAGVTGILLDRIYNTDVSCDYRLSGLTSAADFILHRVR